jgi:hypothetical protein
VLQRAADGTALATSGLRELAAELENKLEK